MRQTRLATVVLLIACALQVSATVVVPLDFAELVGASDTIAHVRVIDLRAAVLAGRTDTVVTAAVSSYVKGGPGEHVTFLIPGGEIGRYRTVVVGAPVLQNGDEIVVFLRRGASGLSTVVGFSQGVLHVSRQAVDGMPMVLSPPVLRDPERDQRVVRGETPGRFIRLERFLQEVRSAMAVEGARQPALPARHAAAGRVPGGR
jgi:hypothetical protein